MQSNESPSLKICNSTMQIKHQIQTILACLDRDEFEVEQLEYADLLESMDSSMEALHNKFLQKYNSEPKLSGDIGVFVSKIY